MISRQTREVAGREIRTRARTTGFRAITAIMLLMAIAAPIVLTVLPDPNDDLRKVDIGIGANAPALTQDYLEVIAADQFDLSFVDVSDRSMIEIEELINSGDIEVVVESATQLAWKGEESDAIGALIRAALFQDAVFERAQAAGLSPAEIGELFSPAEVTSRFVEESETSEGLRKAVAFIGLLAAFILPQVFGQLTLLSVVEEKSSRVVEVLLSHIRPATLLTGKILGLCALAIVQLVIIGAGLLASLLVIDLVDVPAAVWQFVPMLFMSIVAGLALYTTVFALLGSLISRQEDAAQVIMPVFIPMFIGYFAGQAAAFGNAETLFARVLTWFPLTAPMLLPVRVARSAIGPIEVAIVLIILVVSVWLLIRLAARVYEFTLLRTGSRVSWSELIRLSRGAVVDAPAAS